MKNSVLDLTRAVVNDNKEYIEGNIAEYLINEALNAENGIAWYLSDSEIADYSNKVEEFHKEVIEFLNNNFDYDIKDFEF